MERQTNGFYRPQRLNPSSWRSHVTRRQQVLPGCEPRCPSLCCCSRAPAGIPGCRWRSGGPAEWKPHPPQTVPLCPVSETPPRWTPLCTFPARRGSTKPTWHLSFLTFNGRKHSVALTHHPLHHFIHQQLLFCSGQHEKLVQNDHLPQSVHHICWKLLNGAHPAGDHKDKQEQPIMSWYGLLYTSILKSIFIKKKKIVSQWQTILLCS